MTSSIELTTHQHPLSVPADIHARLHLLVPCLASIPHDARVSAWVYAPASTLLCLKKDIAQVILALHLDSETRTDASMIIKLPFTSAESVGRPIFGPAALKLGALTNRAPSQSTMDKLEACRRTYRWIYLKAEKQGGDRLWMPFEPVHGELTAQEKAELDTKDAKTDFKKREEENGLLAMTGMVAI